jgi:hypothetical protein
MSAKWYGGIIIERILNDLNDNLENICKKLEKTQFSKNAKFYLRPNNEISISLSTDEYTDDYANFEKDLNHFLYSHIKNQNMIVIKHFCLYTFSNAFYINYDIFFDKKEQFYWYTIDNVNRLSKKYDKKSVTYFIKPLITL